MSHSLPTSPVSLDRPPVVDRPKIPLGPKGDDSKHATIPLTCPYFTKAIPCPETEIPCPFTHKHSESNASLDLYDQWRAYCDGKITYPKFRTPAQVCSFWRNKACYRKVDECWNAHWLPLGASVSKDPNKEKTCWFWNRGACTKQAAYCKYAHEPKDEIADPPPSYQNRPESRELALSFVSMSSPPLTGWLLQMKICCGKFEQHHDPPSRRLAILLYRMLLRLRLHRCNRLHHKILCIVLKHL